MKHIHKEQLYIKQNTLTNKLFDEDCIFFDIETTGFSPATSNIYLIGCLRKKGDQLIIDQFFAESKEDEKAVLAAFIELLNQYQTIISFNGIGFDIPFIKAKCDVIEGPYMEYAAKYRSIVYLTRGFFMFVLGCVFSVLFIGVPPTIMSWGIILNIIVYQIYTNNQQP